MRSDSFRLRVVAGILAVGLLIAAPDAFSRADGPAPLVREVYVPFGDLNVLLENQPQRVLLTREQYEDLLKKAKKTPETHAPQPALISAADYVGKLQDERAEITGTLAVEVLEDGLHAIPLDISGVGLRRATLDGQGASIGRAPDGKLTLFVQGKGRHTLVLEIVAPLETTAAQQVLTFRLPQPPAARLRITVPGDVEIKSGAGVVSRVVDEPAGVTRFELVPPKAGDTTLVMTLNSRLARRQRAVVARSVLVDEVTQTYERLYATVSLAVLHQAVDRFRFVVPEGFDVTHVTSPLLSRWAIEREGDRRVLDVRLREQTAQTVVLQISAVRAPPVLEQWRFPKLEPLDTVGQIAVLCLLAEDRLSVPSLVPQGIIPVDTSALQAAITASVASAEPGAPPLKSVVAYYAPQGDFSLSGTFTRPPAELSVITNVLLTLGDRGQEIRGGFLLVPKVERLFGFDFSVPAGWQVTSVTGADGKPLALERFGEAGKTGRIHVRLPQGVAPGTECRVYFQAAATPKDWLGAWQTTQMAFPKFVVTGATRDLGAVAVDARDDMVVRPEKLQALTPLDEPEKQRYGLGGVPTSLAYRYEGQNYEAALVVERTQPRMTGRTISFFRVESDALMAHAEIAYQIEEARTRQLSFSLPADTPAAISIRALDEARIKEFVGEMAGDRRRWNVLLEEPRRGTVRLAVDFQQPVPEGKLKQLHLPIAKAEGVAYQSGLVSVEGSAELDVQVSTEPTTRRVDVGELVDASYQPGRRLLGVWSFVGDPPPVTVSVTRQPGFGLYPAIAQKAELSTAISPDGVAQTSAVFQLRTKAVYLEVLLPGDSELWSVLVDDKPTKPQNDRGRLLISLPAAEVNQTRSLKLVYETPILTVPLAGQVRMFAPKLLLRAERDIAAVEVPLADLIWHLFLPTGYEVIRADGTVVGEVKPPEIAALNVAKAGLAAVAFNAGWGSQRAPAIWREAPKTALAPTSTPMPTDAMEASVPSNKAGEAMLGMEAPASRKDEMTDAESADQRFARVGVVDTPMLRAPARRDRSPEAKSDSLSRTTEQAPPHAEAKTAAAPRPTAPPAAPPALMPAMPGGAAGAPGYPVEAEAGPPPAASAPAPEPRAPPPPPAADKLAEMKPKSPVAYKARLEGLSSLNIDLQTSSDSHSRTITFASLGVEPELVVTLANRSRLVALGWAIALTIALVGVARTNRPVGAKTRLIVGVIVVGTLVPLLPYGDTLTLPANMAVYAAALLAPYYLFAGLIKWSACGVHRLRARLSSLRGMGSAHPTAAAMVLVVAACCWTPGMADEPQKTGPYVIQVVGPPEPVTIPDDILILPYDPDSKTGIQDARQILVPYAKYVELWNLAYPDKKLGEKAPPAPYALANGRYATTLQGDESLLVEGQLEIDVFADQFVAVPLGLEGGVLARAELDGKPAQISVAQSAGPPAGQADRAAPPSAATVPGASLAVLHLAGKGRHKLELGVRLRLERRGGWRVVEGVLPAAPATALAITVPQAQTEVRLSQVADRKSYETAQAGQRIETALAHDGRIGIQWRPKIGEAQIDRSLTAQSDALLDVQEDGLRVVWQVALEFRRSQREMFRLVVPADYLVEKVEGANVRGWEVRKEQARQVVDVTLLKAAKDNERLTLRLWRAGRVAEAPLDQFDCPLVNVTDAALESGQLTIRRSPLLDVRTVSRSRVTRTDLADKPVQDPTAAAAADSPLGIRPYEAYQFATMPFSVRLAVAPVVGRVTAAIETILRVGAYERSLESRARLDVRDRPIHRIEVLLPEGLRLDHVSVPGEHHWAVTPRDNQADRRALLTVFLAAGRTGEVPLVIRGQLGGYGLVEEVPLPRLEVLGAQRQEGTIAVQADPAFDLKAVGLQDCEAVLPDRLRAWLKPEQAAATSLALHHRSPAYRGALQLTPRKPDITCDTITNVAFTGRAVEETILLDFNIEQAGARELVFLLPASMRDSRIQVPMLRQKTLEPTGPAPDAPVRVRLQLQDEMMHKVRVLVQNDRLLTSQNTLAPIPVVESGAARRQFVTVQSLGRDEVIVESSAGLEPLGRQQEQWRILQAALGGDLSRAYGVQPGVNDPRLVLATRVRDVLQTAGARIGLAETTVVVDAHGAYRGELTYHVNNSTKQSLEIELPEGATLWTAVVAGEPVKPIKAATPLLQAGEGPGVMQRRVRIPLVKTAPGDLDYPVVLKYGGHLKRLGHFTAVNFPLIRTGDIQVELSHVRLYLPETHRFFDFGGTLRRAASEDELVAGRLSYETKLAQRLIDTMRQADEFAKVRAQANLKQWGMLFGKQPLAVSSGSERVRQEVAQNALVLREAEVEAAKLQQAPAQRESDDNRARLQSLFDEQRTSRAKNVVKDLGRNFDAPADLEKSKSMTPAGRLNEAWLANSQLAGPAGKEALKEEAKLDKAGGALQFRKEARVPTDESAVSPGIAVKQPAAPPAPQAQMETQEGRRAARGRGAVERYQERLERSEQQARQGQPVGDLVVSPKSMIADGKAVKGAPSKFGALSAGETPAVPAVQLGADSDVRKNAAAGAVAQAALPAGLASLDFEIPKRGALYRFTTPGGDVELSARAVSVNLIEKLARAVAVLAAAGLIAILGQRAARGGLAWLASPLGWAAMIVLGMVLLLNGFLLAGMALFVAGVVLAVRRAVHARRPRIA